MAQDHVDKIVYIAFTKKDKGEFECECSKVKAAEMIQSWGPFILDDDWPGDNDGSMDIDKSIAAKSTNGCLDKKNIFLANFLNRKLIEIGNRKTAARNLNLDKPSVQRNTFQIRRGDKVFNITVQ